MKNPTKFYKLTEEEIERLSNDEIISKLEPNIQKIISEKIEDFKDTLILQIADTESPIERMLILALNDIFSRAAFKNKGLDLIDIDAQVDVTCNGKNYVADIMIGVWDVIKKVGISFVIECDGHDFHEKTKEQVKRDNERNRDFAKQGYTMIHFSGSEIVTDTHKCAREALEIVLNAFKR